MAAPTTQLQQQQEPAQVVDSAKTNGAQLGALEEDDEFEEFDAEGNETIYST